MSLAVSDVAITRLHTTNSFVFVYALIRASLNESHQQAFYGDVINKQKKTHRNMCVGVC